MKQLLSNCIEGLSRSIEAEQAVFTDMLKIPVVGLYVMNALYQQDSQHPSDLARSIGRAATSFTPILDKLQHVGLLERKPDPTDRRAVLICLTNEGKALRKEIVGHLDAFETRLAAEMMARINKPGATLEAVFAPLPPNHPF